MRLVSETDAPAPVRAIFDEVRHCLGVPAVPVLYQLYASVPRFLELHWQVFKPLLQKPQVFLLGSRLAAEAYTRSQSYFGIPDILAQFEGPRLIRGVPDMMQALDYFQYLDSLLLLITVAQMQAFEGTVGQTASDTPEPGGRKVFDTAPQLAEASAVAPAIARLWEERRRFLNLGFVPEEHRALAVWPEVYQRCWASLRPLVQSPLYADCQFRIGESAWGLVQELPAITEMEIPSLLEAGITDEQISSISRLNESLMRAFTGLLLYVTFTRIGLEGGSHQQSWHSHEKNAPKVQAA